MLNPAVNIPSESPAVKKAVRNARLRDYTFTLENTTLQIEGEYVFHPAENPSKDGSYPGCAASVTVETMRIGDADISMCPTFEGIEDEIEKDILARHQ